MEKSCDPSVCTRCEKRSDERDVPGTFRRSLSEADREDVRGSQMPSSTSRPETWHGTSMTNVSSSLSRETISRGLNFRPKASPERRGFPIYEADQVIKSAAKVIKDHGAANTHPSAPRSR